MSTTTTPAPTRIRSTTTYKNLRKRGFSPEDAERYAREVKGATTPAPQALTREAKVQALVSEGLTQQRAEQLVDNEGKVQAEAPKELTPAEKADALVAQQGFVHRSGRVYLNTAIVEAFARVRRSGEPEVVALATGRSTAAVVLFRTEDGAVACQNLRHPKEGEVAQA